jgi:hypothetical protein
MARKDTALYFTDYDNHVFELNVDASLDEVLAGCAQQTYTLHA